MKLNPFAKTKDTNTKPTKKAPVRAQKTDDVSSIAVAPATVNAKAVTTNRVLKHLYVSEKATMLTGFHQYVFVVHATANKSEIKKQVQKIFDVTVEDVKVMHMPEKRRDMGKHPGMKAGFKKAIVTLKKGQAIQQGQQSI